MKIVLAFLVSLIASFLILAFFFEEAKQRAYKKDNVSATNSPEYRVFATFLFLYYPLLVIIMTTVFFILLPW